MFFLFQQTTPYELVYGQKPRVVLQDLPIPLQTLIDLNDEVELNALLGVEEYMGMEDVEAADYESEDYESDSCNEFDVPGIRRSVVVEASTNSDDVEAATVTEETVYVSQQGL